MFSLRDYGTYQSVINWFIQMIKKFDFNQIPCEKENKNYLMYSIAIYRTMREIDFAWSLVRCLHIHFSIC